MPIKHCPNCSKSFDIPRQRYCSLACSLWSRVVQGGEDDCWEWTGTRKAGGYGGLGFKSVRYDVHRLAYQLSHRDPGENYVCHRCDNPICCNPAHLFAGTQTDNVRDMDAKGRRKNGAPKGSQHSLAKLTDEMVLDIRRNYQGVYGERRDLARRFGVSTSTISSVLCGKSWRHLSCSNPAA